MLRLKRQSALEWLSGCRSRWGPGSLRGHSGVPEARRAGAWGWLGSLRGHSGVPEARRAGAWGWLGSLRGHSGVPEARRAGAWGWLGSLRGSERHFSDGRRTLWRCDAALALDSARSLAQKCAHVIHVRRAVPAPIQHSAQGRPSVSVVPPLLLQGSCHPCQRATRAVLGFPSVSCLRRFGALFSAGAFATGN